MKIHAVKVNNRKSQLELSVRSGKMLPIPFARLDPRPSANDRIERVFVDKELGREAVTYLLESGREGADCYKLRLQPAADTCSARFAESIVFPVRNEVSRRHRATRVEGHRRSVHLAA